MLKIIFNLIFFSFPFLILGQNSSKKEVIDNIKTEIYKDTIKFEKNDLIFTALGRKNLNSYSKLYIIDKKYYYKLDIIKEKAVQEFVKEYLSESKVETIEFIEKEKGMSFYGSNAENGVVIISINKKINYNPKVAGLKLNSKKTGTNYSEKNKEEFIIRN